MANAQGGIVTEMVSPHNNFHAHVRGLWCSGSTPLRASSERLGYQLLEISRPLSPSFCGTKSCSDESKQQQQRICQFMPELKGRAGEHPPTRRGCDVYICTLWYNDRKQRCLPASSSTLDFELPRLVLQCVRVCLRGIVPHVDVHSSSTLLSPRIFALHTILQYNTWYNTIAGSVFLFPTLQWGRDRS